MAATADVPEGYYDRFENADDVRAAHDRVEEDLAEERAEQFQHADTWARIQGKLDSLSRPVTVVGEEVEMRPVGTDAVIEALEEAEGLTQDELDELEAAAKGDPEASDIEQLANDSEDVLRLMNVVAAMMDEFCVDQSMSRDRWGQVPPQFLMAAFEEWSQRRLTPEEIDRVNSFRGE